MRWKGASASKQVEAEQRPPGHNASWTMIQDVALARRRLMKTGCVSRCWGYLGSLTRYIHVSTTSSPRFYSAHHFPGEYYRSLNLIQQTPLPLPAAFGATMSDCHTGTQADTRPFDLQRSQTEQRLMVYMDTRFNTIQQTLAEIKADNAETKANVNRIRSMATTEPFEDDV